MTHTGMWQWQGFIAQSFTLQQESDGLRSLTTEEFHYNMRTFTQKKTAKRHRSFCRWVINALQCGSIWDWPALLFHVETIVHIKTSYCSVHTETLSWGVHTEKRPASSVHTEKRSAPNFHIEGFTTKLLASFNLWSADLKISLSWLRELRRRH